MWVEYNGVPLKWHVPTGVLLDFHAPNASICYLWRPSIIYADTDEIWRPSIIYADTDEIVGAAEEQMWVEYNGVPLKWHVPTGVLLDLHAPNAVTFRNSTPPQNRQHIFHYH